MKKILFICALGLTTLPSLGQQKKWQELEGVFQSPANKEMYVRFTATDSLLVAHLLWNGAEIHLLPDTGLAFVSKESEDGNPIRISFQRDGASGGVDRVSVANNGVWTRAKDYRPVVKQEMAHTPEQLQKFAGLYQILPDSSEYVEVSVENNSLTLHWILDNGTQQPFVPAAEGKFFRKDLPILTLDFTQDGQGRVTQMEFLGRLHYLRIARSSPTPAQLRSYEGKFRSTDDPDNMVQLIADGNALVVRELWNKKEIRLQPFTTTCFNDEHSSFPLQVFTENGRIKALRLFGNQTFGKVE